MSDNKTEQSNNQVGGNLAGRDVNTTRSLSFVSPALSVSPLKSLYQKFQAEQLADPQIKKLVEDLDNYRQIVDVKVIGLEQKLTEGSQTSSIEYALRAKEFFYKKLVKYEMFETAQKINAHLLARVESRFMNHVYPKICSGYAEEEIKDLLEELIVTPLLNYLEENPLDYTARDINGMIYFLTGNCHIKWTK